MDSVINEQKFLQFYDKNVMKIYRYIYFRVGSEQVAQDLSSEAFLKTWQYLNDGKYIGNLSAMIYQVCRNLIADYFRNNNKSIVSIDDVANDNFNEAESDLAVLTQQSMEIEEIKECFGCLKEEYQELIIWRYVDDLSIEEIAQIAEKSEGAVRTSLSRATKALKEVFESR